jgi:hypothetical protein
VVSRALDAVRRTVEAEIQQALRERDGDVPDPLEFAQTVARRVVRRLEQSEAMS